tara:strand:- start:96 stop:608 length:513 start_codon:yes stop_codon:yes gene_type:complete
MKKRYTANESYTHKCAKEVFKSWCDSDEWNDGSGYTRFDTSSNGCISWRSNRGQNAWLEYPIVETKNTNSIESNWDEIWPDKRESWNSFIPTFDDCKKHNLIPIAVVDIVLPHKGRPEYFVEICHTNPVSDEKLAKLEKAGMRNLIEIDAEWILSQTDIPSKIQIKRWLL